MRIDHAETVSGKTGCLPEDSRFHYSARQSEVESANEKMVAYVEGRCGGTLS